MNEVYLWIATALVGAVAVTTISRFWTERTRFWKDELHDEDRLFAWRIVLFLIYPILVGIDLRATLTAAQFFGGTVPHWSYGLFWFSAIPQGVGLSENLVLVLFAGAIVQILLAVSLLPSLFFRPHPFLATTIAYTIITILGANLVVEPLLSLAGIGGSRWKLATLLLNPHDSAMVIAIDVVLASIFIGISSLQRTRLWFADLTRPVAAEKLRDALMQLRLEPRNLGANARVAVLYERAGFHRESNRYLKQLQKLDNKSLYSVFTYAVLKYRDRKYKASREAFLLASDYPYIDPVLKGSLLAASACAAFAQGEVEAALNLSERALEFDDASLVARMVKVDVFLRTGRKEQAGDEIIAAIRRGLDMDLESKIPLDVERALHRIGRSQSALEKRTQSAPAATAPTLRH